MAIAYTWQFVALDVYPTNSGLTDVVESMHWILEADDGLDHTAKAYGEAKAGPPDPNNFTPFNELTLEIVQGWTEEAIGASDVDAIKVSLVGQISEQISPTIVGHPPPWL